MASILGVINPAHLEVTFLEGTMFHFGSLACIAKAIGQFLIEPEIDINTLTAHFEA